jgi:hypothetical protein
MHPDSQPPRSNASARPWIIAWIAFAIVFGWLSLAQPDQAEDTPPSASSDDPVQPAAATPPAAAALTTQHRAAPPAADPAKAPGVPATPPAPAAPEPPPRRGPIPPDTRGFFIDAIQDQYEQAARESDAAGLETALRAFLRERDVPASAVRSVLCRKAICKLELYWRPEYDAPYRGALDDLANGNAKAVATRADDVDKRGGVSVDVYWVRALGAQLQR